MCTIGLLVSLAYCCVYTSDRGQRYGKDNLAQQKVIGLSFSLSGLKSSF